MLNIEHSFPILHYTTAARLLYAVFEDAVLTVGQAKDTQQALEDWEWLFVEEECEYPFSCGYISEHVFGVSLLTIRTKVYALLTQYWKENNMLETSNALYGKRKYL